MVYTHGLSVSLVLTNSTYETMCGVTHTAILKLNSRQARCATGNERKMDYLVSPRDCVPDNCTADAGALQSYSFGNMDVC